MESRFFDLLPQQLQQHVLEIEQAIGKPIGVRRRTNKEYLPAELEEFASVSCYFENDEAIVDISYPDENLVAHSLMHEIMHAYRYIVLGIPCVGTKIDAPALKLLANILDNDIEHVFIIPSEIEFVPEAEAYWDQFYNVKLDEIELSIESKQRRGEDIVDEQNFLLRMCAATGGAPHFGFRTRLQALIVRINSVAKVNNFMKDLISVHPNKADMVAVLLAHTNISTAPFCLNYFDVPNKRMMQGDIPKLAPQLREKLMAF
jgi:hypothetical protein